MPRIQGVDIPPDKPTHISLRYIRGLGPTTSLEVCEKLHIDPHRRAKELSDDEIARIASLLDREYLVEGPVDPQVLATVTAWCAQIDVLATDMRVEQRSLEDVFLDLTGRKLRP